MKKLNSILLFVSLTVVFFVFNGEVPFIQNQNTENAVNKTGGDDPTKDPNYATNKKNFWNAYQIYQSNLSRGFVTQKPIDASGMFKIDEHGSFAFNQHNEITNNIAPPPTPTPDVVSGYTFTQPSGTYTSITGGVGTVILASGTIDDNSYANNPIGFTFALDAINYTAFGLNANGWILMGTGTPVNSYAVLSDAANFNVIAVQAADLYGTATGKIEYQTSGVAPNRVLTIQWSNWGFFLSDGSVDNFQIKLFETSNNIQMIYGPFAPSATTHSPQVGIKGAVAADFNDRQVLSSGTWAASTAGAANSSSCYLSNTVFPATNLTFQWAPPAPTPMTYVSSNTVQVLNGVPALQSSTNQQIVQVQVVTSGNTLPFSVTNFNLGTNGSTAPGTDITNCKVYYTGTSNVFATTTLVGTTVSPNGTFNLTGSQVLSAGTNYFWVTYDIAAGGVVQDLVDAQCNSITGTGTMGTVVPTTIAPAGNRFVDRYCVGQFTNAGSCCSLYMSNVTFGSINNNTGFDPNANFPYAYTNYTALSTSVSAGSTYSISVTEPSSGNANGFSVWFDWNQNGTFTDAGEFTSIGLIPSGGSTTITGSVTVPPGATLGNTRMRVRSNFSSAPLSTDACTTLSYGETEDYTVNVTAASNMTFVSSTCTQTVLTAFTAPSVNTQILGVQIVTNGTLNPLNATSFTLNTNGSTNPTVDITNAKLWYTGTSSTFATTTQVGATFSSPNGSFIINGSQTLAAGTNYFWVTYDVPGTAVAGHVVDAECNSLTVVSPQVPTVQAPAGNRLIAAPICGTYSVGPTGNYASITAAVADISVKGLCGPAILELQPAYVSGVETFPLSFTTITGFLNSTNTLTVRPQTGATSRVITSANATATIDLNGVQYVNFDGRQGGAGTNRDLTLDNTGFTSVVRFINTAVNCSLKYCTITSNETSTANGNIFFSTTTGVIQGNSNNTIDNCDIKDNASQPLNLIYSSGSTSAGLLNSNNTVSNCLMSNYFGASSATNGISLSSGNTAWTITGNKFFQTATRTYTVGTIHAAIRISSTTAGAGGFTINNNIIGYSSSSQTGTYTMAGAVASTFTGISLTQSVTGTVSSIQGNTMTAFNLTTSAFSSSPAVWCGISVTQGDCNIGTTAANFIGDAATTGAITMTASSSGANIVGINDASTGNITINNTTIGSITASGTSTLISTAITAINVTTGIPTITNNTIGSSSVANSLNCPTVSTSVTAGTLFGINVSVVTGTTTINNNTINNLNNAGTTTAHVTRGIIYSGTSPATINNNTITNLVCGGSFAGVTGLASVNGIVVTNSVLGAGVQIKSNTINTLNSSNAGLFNTGSVGIATVLNIAGAEISFNKIYDIRNASTLTTATTPPCAVGIQFRQSPDSIRIFNNFVSLGNGQTTNTEFIGILNNFNTVAIMKTSFNSVNIEGAAASGLLPTFCFYRGDFGNTNTINTPVIIYNNIFNNTRSGGTGKHYAIGNQESSPSTNWVAGNVNNNVLNAPVASIIGLWGVATDQSFTQWKTSSVNDAQSISGVPVIFSNSALGDLHLNFGVTPTGLESGGIPYAGITTDIDGQVRPGPAGSVNGGATAPDLGADEFDGVPADVIAPAISYTAMGNGNVAATRTFPNVTATDNSGINTTPGTRPRVYYKKSGDANTFVDNTSATNGWKYVESNGTTSPFDFTINYALLNAGSVSVGDIVQYFVVAQDNAATPNVGINSGTFTSQPASVNLAAGNFPITGTINQFSITANVFSGGYTVGTGFFDTWPSLTNAGGFFDALNNGSISGNITVGINSDLTTETGAVTLNTVSETGAGGYTVTIVPNTNSLKTISGNPGGTTALVKLNGTKRVTIDGRFGGAGPSLLTFQNTNITAGTGGETFRITNDANNVTLKYLTIQGNCQGFVGGVINITGTSSTIGNQNITIDNCNISNFTGGNPFQGITSWGQSQNFNNTNINITNNNIFEWGVNSAATNCVAVWLQYTSNALIQNNSMYRTTALTAVNLNDFVIETPSGTGPGNTITGNYIGGTAPLCGGTAWTTTTTIAVYTIDLIDISLHTTATTVTNNTIKNISLTWSGTGATTMFNGIFNRGSAGACTISGNQIGDNTVDASVSPSILVTNTTALTLCGLETIDSRSGNGAISNNNIGGLRCVRTSTSTNLLNVIFSGTQGTKNITGNLVGSSSTDNMTSNKVSQDEIERLRRLPNYEAGDVQIKTDVKGLNVKGADKNGKINNNNYTQVTKDGRVLILPSSDIAVMEDIKDNNSNIDQEKMMQEKLRIEKERMNGVNYGNNSKGSIIQNTLNNPSSSDNVNKNTPVQNIPLNTMNQSAIINNQKGDNPNATIANISMESPQQVVGIFSSGFGGTISNNTIANIVINNGSLTTASFSGINLSNASSVAQNDVITNNTLRNINYLGSVAATPVFITVATTYPGTATITGNTVSTISIAPLLSASIGMTGIQSTGSGFHNITGNTITAVSCGTNLSGGAFTGILVADVAPATMIVSNNFVQNYTLNSGVSSLHTFSGLSLSGSGDYTVSSNTINNISTNTNSSNSNTVANAFTGIFSTLSSSTNSPAVNTINANTITNITVNPFTTATTITMQGIFQNSSTAVSNITKNYITGFLTNSTSTFAQVYGWYSFFGQRTTMSNNIFDLGNGITTDNQVYDCYDYSDEPLGYFYDNTFRIRGTVTSGTDFTTCYWRNATASNVTDMRNNIFSNERTGGTGSHMAVTTSVGTAGWIASNYNDYYSSNPATTGRWGSVTDLTLAQWKTNSSQDALTFSRLASFTATSRINASDLSVSGRGDYIPSVTTDIDGDARPTSQSTTVKPVDVGADQYLPSGYTGNICSLSGAIYQDGGLNAVEVVSGAFTVTSVKQYPGVRSPNNTFTGKPVNGNKVKDVNKKEGKSGSTGGEMLVPVNEPWVYWELPGFAPTTEPVVLRFYYNVNMLSTITESTLRVTYWNGTGWDNSFTPQSVNTLAHYIQVQLPTGFTWTANSQFAIEANNNPLPVTLASFNASAAGRDANVTWVTTSEMNNKGFNLERRNKAGINNFTEWQSVAFINGHGNSTTNNTYTYSDKKLNAGDYEYRLKQVDFNGNFEYHDMTGQQDLIIGKPMISDMSQNYPNPSNPKTKIDYQIPFDGKVSIKVYDLTGREITTLVDKTQQAGYYTAEFDGTNLASGIYFYRIISQGDNQKFTKTLKMVLVK